MAKRSKKPSMVPMADPTTITSIIRKRSAKGGPPRPQTRVGEALSPFELVCELISHHNYLNTHGPTDKLSDIRKWLFDYVVMYRSQVDAEDKVPELAFRTPFIKASEPFTKEERRSIAEAEALKKQINMQARALRSRNVWW